MANADIPARNYVLTSGDRRRSAERRRVLAGCGTSNTSRGDSRMVSGERGSFLGLIFFVKSECRHIIINPSGRTQWQRSARSPLLHEGLSPNLRVSLSQSYLLPVRHTKIHDFMHAKLCCAYPSFGCTVVRFEVADSDILHGLSPRLEAL